MRQRAKSLGGDVQWASDQGKGCSMIVRLPVRRSTFGKAAV